MSHIVQRYWSGFPCAIRDIVMEKLIIIIVKDSIFSTRLLITKMWWIEAMGILSILLLLNAYTRQELLEICSCMLCYGYLFTLGLGYFLTSNTWMYAILNLALFAFLALCIGASGVVPGDKLYYPITVPIMVVCISTTLWGIIIGYHILGLCFPIMVIIGISYLPNVLRPLPDGNYIYQKIYLTLLILGCYIAVRR